MGWIPTSTTDGLRKHPFRTIRADVGIISDLRPPNLLCVKEDYPAVHLADMVVVEEREVSIKRTWSKCCRRDIDAALKRVRAHPNMSIILRAEFRANTSRWEGFIILISDPLWMGGAAAYFPSVGGGSVYHIGIFRQPTSGEMDTAI